MALYTALMGEVKIRASWIDYASQGRTGMPGQFVREFGFLQLRMICELVALACLVAHGDIAATKTTALQGAFSANDIIKGLEKLNPEAFPSPILLSAPGGGYHHYEDRPEADWMTKPELLSLYGRECGTALHKGSLKNLMTPLPPVEKNFPDLIRPLQRILNLLGSHRIALDEGNLQFMCFLGDYSEEVQTTFAFVV